MHLLPFYPSIRRLFIEALILKNEANLNKHTLINQINCA